MAKKARNPKHKAKPKAHPAVHKKQHKKPQHIKFGTPTTSASSLLSTVESTVDSETSESDEDENDDPNTPSETHKSDRHRRRTSHGYAVVDTNRVTQQLARLSVNGDDETDDNHDEEDDDDELDEEEDDEEFDEEDDNDEDDDDNDEEDDGADSDSSSGSRDSDDEYEMEYDKIAEVMHKALTQTPAPLATDASIWRPVQSWNRPQGEQVDLDFIGVPSRSHFRKTISDAQWLVVPHKKIAGSCHQLLLAYILHQGHIHRRIVKVARDPDEDNHEHFAQEMAVNIFLSEVATFANANFESRTDFMFWPVEFLKIEWQGRERWAMAQAPFVPDPQLGFEFCKVEPNSGDRLHNDPVVMRFQHLVLALTNGLYLIRDWQGYSVPRSLFLEMANEFAPEAKDQIRDRPPNTKGTRVMCCIDPVLVSHDAHFKNNNKTDFGLEALQEWKKVYDFDWCRAKQFGLLKDFQYGFSDVGQKFFEDNPVLEAKLAQLHQQLGIWTGDNNNQSLSINSGATVMQ